MPPMLLRFSAVMSALVLSVASASAEIKWFTDLEEAKKAAQAEKKLLLVDFTGSDWCGWCIRLKKEVFDQKEFEAAAKDFVLVELDFPQKKKLPPEQQAKNDALAKKYDIQGFPTVLLMDAQGEVFAQTGYQEGGPAAYLKMLAELSKQNTPEGKAKLKVARELEAKEEALNEKLEAVLEPLLAKADAKAAEEALAKFIGAEKLEGELYARIVSNARLMILMTTRPDDPAAVLALVDQLLADPKFAGAAEQLREIRPQVVLELEESKKKSK